MEFKCSGCGLCCANLGKVIDAVKGRINPTEMDKMFIDFPYPINEDGSCSQQKDSGECSVYDDRPDVCNVEKMYETQYKPYMTKEQHYKEGNKICNQMIEEAGLPDKYLIKIDQDGE